jgi:hypothetical protein
MHLALHGSLHLYLQFAEEAQGVHATIVNRLKEASGKIFGVPQDLFGRTQNSSRAELDERFKVDSTDPTEDAFSSPILYPNLDVKPRKLFRAEALARVCSSVFPAHNMCC